MRAIELAGEWRVPRRLGIVLSLLATQCIVDAPRTSQPLEVSSEAVALARPDHELYRLLSEPGAEDGFSLSAARRFVSAGERRLAARPERMLDARVPVFANQAIELRVGGNSDNAITLKLDEASASPAQLEGKLISYAAIQPGTDALLRSWPRGLQVLYVLRSPASASSWRWRISTSKAFSALRQNGESVQVLDEAGNAALVMPPGFALAADGERIAVLPRWDAERATVEWRLEHAPRAYPVLVDPVVQLVTWEQLGVPDSLYAPRITFDSARSSLIVGGSPVQGWSGVGWYSLGGRDINSANIVYDGARQRVLYFGGAGNGGDSTELWDGASSSWSYPTLASKPASRRGHVMTYDSERQRVVLFGGITGGAPPSSYLGDTWEWDGSSWLLRSPVNAPAARTEPGFAFDSKRKKAVLFGGSHGGGRLSDVCEWDGTDWACVNPASGPSARDYPSLTFDAVRGKVVLFGGIDATGLRNDTWEWDGLAWSPVTSAVVATTQQGGITFDDVKQRVLLVTSEPKGVYALTGGAWLPLVGGAAGPAARYFHATAYDTKRKRGVMFGGYWPGVTTWNDTWEWDGSVWTEKFPATQPPPRSAHAMSFDSLRNVVVMVGGWNNSAGVYPGGTWEWDGIDWIDRGGNPPSSLQEHAIAYDAARKNTLLFSSNTTHTWNGTSWTPLSPATVPAARVSHAMVYDSVRGKVVMIGGTTTDYSRQPLNQIWEWDGTDWTNATPNPAPVIGASPAVAFDARRSVVVVQGGGTISYPVFGTQEWDGAGWSPLAAATEPGMRVGSSAFYDTQSGRVVLFAGATTYASGNLKYGDDTWTLVVGRTKGSDCTSAGQCATNYCVDGVCCDSACGAGVNSDCLACSVAGGATSDGTCGPRAVGASCGTLTASVCDAPDVCQGATLATAVCKAKFAASSVVCRNSAEACDVAEKCTGKSASCPPDGFLAANTECRPSVGECDLAESCPGGSAACPPDEARPEGALCGPATSGACDVEDGCMGTVGATATCQARVLDVDTPCRAASDSCDVAELCDGTSQECPLDGRKQSGSSCDDGDACTQSDQCDALGCHGPALTCDDDDPCTTDVCLPATGCAHELTCEPGGGGAGGAPDASAGSSGLAAGGAGEAGSADAPGAAGEGVGIAGADDVPAAGAPPTGSGGAAGGVGSSPAGASPSTAEDGGCGCRVAKSSDRGTWLLGLVAAVGLLRRRRRAAP